MRHPQIGTIKGDKHMPSSDTQFKKGHPGRPKGAKNKLAKAYLKDLHEIYLDGGKEALRKVMEERPDGFLNLVARLLPKDLDVKHSGDVTIQIIDYQDKDEQADSEQIASNGSVPISLVE